MDPTLIFELNHGYKVDLSSKMDSTLIFEIIMDTKSIFELKMDRKLIFEPKKFSPTYQSGYVHAAV